MKVHSKYFLICVFFLFFTACSSDKAEEARVSGKSKYNNIEATSIVNGRVPPYGKSGQGPSMIITQVSEDKTYGYSLNNPIKVGGRMDNKGPANEKKYLNSLYGPKGEVIAYGRIGSCCSFSTPNGPLERGLLDKFRITYEGLKEPIFLYLNMYDYEKPQAPYGFSIIPQFREDKMD